MKTSTKIELAPLPTTGTLLPVSPKGYDSKGKPLGGPGRGQGRKQKIGFRKVSFKLHEATLELMSHLPSESRFETVDKILRDGLTKLLKRGDFSA
jgi:hypothetical protein